MTRLSTLTYSRVCGHVIAYQHRNTLDFYTLITQNRTIEQHYLDGVSITHGSAGSREHAGHLLVPWVMDLVTDNFLAAAAVVTTGHIQHLSLEMITSVILVIIIQSNLRTTTFIGGDPLGPC